MSITFARDYEVPVTFSCILIDDGFMNVDRLDFQSEQPVITSQGTCALWSGRSDHLAPVHIEVHDQRTEEALPHPAREIPGHERVGSALLNMHERAPLELRFMELLSVGPVQGVEPFPVPARNLLVEARVFKRPQEAWQAAARQRRERDLERWFVRISPSD